MASVATATLSDEELKEAAKKQQEEKNALFSMLPTHCQAYMPPPPDPNKVVVRKKQPTPIRVLEPTECFKACPRIVSRQEWGARKPKVPAVQMMYRVRPSVFDETDCPNCDNEADCERVIRVLQMYQMDYMKFDDIAYSFLIGEDGRIYEGRGWAYANEKAEGFCGIGYLGSNSTTEPLEGPSDAMLQATYDLIMCGVQKGFIANPFTSGAYTGATPIELIKELILSKESIDYQSKPSDFGTYE